MNIFWLASMLLFLCHSSELPHNLSEILHKYVQLFLNKYMKTLFLSPPIPSLRVKTEVSPPPPQPCKKLLSSFKYIFVIVVYSTVLFGDVYLVITNMQMQDALPRKNPIVTNDTDSDSATTWSNHNILSWWFLHRTWLGNVLLLLQWDLLHVHDACIMLTS